jgi:hypothetical protein
MQGLVLGYGAIDTAEIGRPASLAVQFSFRSNASEATTL